MGSKINDLMSQSALEWLGMRVLGDAEFVAVTKKVDE